MEPFLKSYYEKFMHKSIDSYQFKDYFLAYFKDCQAVNSIDWDQWFNAPGMPKYKPKFDDSLAKVCNALEHRWTNWDDSGASTFSKSDMEKFSTGQKIEFLSLLLQGKPLR